METGFLKNKADEILYYLREIPYADETVRYYGCC